jgi:hypothetical protein
MHVISRHVQCCSSKNDVHQNDSTMMPAELGQELKIGGFFLFGGGGGLSRDRAAENGSEAEMAKEMVNVEHILDFLPFISHDVFKYLKLKATY